MGRFDDAISRIDAANAADPSREAFEGEIWPKELLYSRRMTGWLERLAPEASEPLRLAARAQHVERWQISRQDYAEGRKGYLLWRTALYRYHAERAREILAGLGYDPATIDRVGALLQKKRLRSDAEVQTLEDAACLVFLENYFAAFAKKHDEEKIVDIVRKTWVKMSANGHRAALDLVGSLPADARRLVEAALADGAE
ncbi:MAG: DUF4202 domain-containing protein [Chloroflexi bacterium]|nr:DUF4202 domain-containing protein [Chloroflexota bacterium]